MVSVHKNSYINPTIFFRGPKQLIKNKTNIDLLVASAKDDVVAITLEGRYKICCRHIFLYK